jgi:glycosyltransferase involved in cell wall biosynthesis
MKVLHVIDSGGLYGAEVMLLNLVTEQARLGLEPVIASIGEPHIVEKPLETEALRRGVRVEKFRMRPGPNIPGAFRVLRFAWREKFDLLHSHGYKGNILFGFLPRSFRRLPLVATVHGWCSTGGMNRMRVYEWLDSLSLDFIDQVVLVSESMRTHSGMRKRVIQNCQVVNNGIPVTDDGLSVHDSEVEGPMDRGIVDFCRGGYTLGAIGRLSPEKGFDILLDAVKEVTKTNPEVRLVILGEGGERGSLEAKIRDLGLEGRVLMPGYMANAKWYLSLIRVFVLSSLTEGLPMVILEAMLAGVPIVSTSVGGVPEVLLHGKAGILVPALSAPALADGMSSMITNAAAATTMVETGKELVMTRYSASTMAVNYNKIYECLMGS